MAEKIEIVNGELKITKTPSVTVETLTKDDVINKRAEAQTKADHLQLDLDAAKAEMDKIDAYLVDIDKDAIEPK